MRAVAMVVLALWTTSCAPAGMFDLAPRETGASSRVGSRWIGTESSQSTVSASFERTWLDHLLFEVEVVNHSDSILVIDPAQFSLTLSRSTEDPSRKPPRPFAPESPARVLARLQRESSAGPGLSDAALGLTGLVIAAVIVAAVVAGRSEITVSGTAAEPESECASAISPGYEPDRNTWALRRTDAGRELERSPETLLYKTELAPGQSVRGELWFPARKLRSALGPRTYDESAGAWRVTTTPSRHGSDCAVTLRAPASLGGQELDYFAWSE